MTIVKHTTSKRVNVTHANKDLNSQKDSVKAHYQWKILSRIIIAKLFRKMFVLNVTMGTI